METKIKIEGKPTFKVSFLGNKNVKICGENFTLKSDNMLENIEELKEIIRNNF